MPYARDDVTVGTIQSLTPWAGSFRGDPLDFPRQTSVQASAEGLRVGDDLIATSSIGPVRLDLGERVRVVIEVDGRTSPLAIVCPDVADACSLMTALGVRAERTPTRFATPATVVGQDALRSVTTVAVVLVTLVAFVAFGASTKLGWFGRIGGGLVSLVSLLAGVLVVPMLGRSAVEVGLDGVRMLWMWRTTFVPWSDVVSVVAREETVDLELRGGRRLELSPTTAEHVADIAARIEEARSEAAKPKASEDLRLLASGGPVGTADVAALRELGKERSASYRAARVERDTLWRIVEDPAQDGVTRARAAVALSAELDLAQKKRLRVAAEATASPKVRVAIERVVSGAKDEHLATALAELEGDGAGDGDSASARGESKGD